MFAKCQLGQARVQRGGGALRGGSGLRRRAVGHVQLGAQTEHAGNAAADDATGGCGVQQAVVRRVNPAGAIVVPGVHTLPVGADQADAEERLRRAGAAGEIAGDADQRL